MGTCSRLSFGHFFVSIFPLREKMGAGGVGLRSWDSKESVEREEGEGRGGKRGHERRDSCMGPGRW